MFGNKNYPMLFNYTCKRRLTMYPHINFVVVSHQFRVILKLSASYFRNYATIGFKFAVHILIIIARLLKSFIARCGWGEHTHTSIMFGSGPFLCFTFEANCY